MTTYSRQMVSWATDECDRQHTDVRGVERLLWALDYARAIQVDYRYTQGLVDVPTCLDAMRLANLIEPLSNPFGGAMNNFRNTPVAFFSGGSSSKPKDVWADTTRHFALMSELLVDDEWDKTHTDEWIKRLLDIHPWADGNGRTASVLWNWLNDTLDSPEMLPYYYGE